MAYELGPISLANPAGAWAFSALIPLILLYLIRPRPVRMEIPSLMFFLQSKENPKQQNFFRKITKDWLFLIQLLILLLLAFHLMKPFTTYEHDITAENTVIVLDASASSQVKEQGRTRFDIGREHAKEALGGKNTIILAKSTPKIIANDMDSDEAHEVLDALVPGATPSAIGDAMVLAGETLGNREGRVVVISDFINTDGMDPETARSVLESKGVIVDLIDTSTPTHHTNVGFVNMEIDEESTTISVQNFDEESVQATVSAGSFRKQLNLGPQSSDSISFETPQENTQVQLDVDDDFPLDNMMHIATPKRSEISVLLITNNESPFLRNALTTLDGVELEVATPPIVPSGRFDVFVIHRVRPDALLPGTFETIEDHVLEGSNAIITAQSDMDRINYKNLLPTTRGGRQGHAFVQVEQLNTFTRNLEFGSVSGYWEMEPRQGAITIASDGFNTSLIALQQRGAGKIVYFGIEESASDFKLSPSYPVFWVKLLQFLMGQESVSDLNVRTGETAIFETVETIATPTGTRKQNALLFEYQGLYRFDDKDMAANLLYAKESQVNPAEATQVIAERQVELKPVQETRKFSFEVPLAIAVLCLLFLELTYTKWRGDY